MDLSTKDHWEKVYKTKDANQMSWTEEVPHTSLDFIHSFHLSKSCNIIDVGGGNSQLAYYLLEEGFKNITVLDISEAAIEKARKRLGNKASKITWIVSDIKEFAPDNPFDVWHDRATFHFLTKGEEISKYLETARKSVRGYLTIGTFSEKGPKKCSGLETRQYSEQSLTKELHNGFQKLYCITEDHRTPFDTTQNFLFCGFKRKID